MTLIECKECGKSISDKAHSCPNCGFPVSSPEIIVSETEPAKPKQKKTLIIGIVLLLVIAGFLMMISDSDTSGGGNDKPETTEETKDERNEELKNEVSAVALYEAIAGAANDPFTISEASYGFINAHPEYFPGNSDNRGAISDYVEEDISYDHVTKSPSKYQDTLINGWGDVIDIEETEIEGKTVTAMQVVDYDGNNYLLYHLGSLDHVFKDSYVWFYGLPFDIISFENMGGGYTEAIVCGTCYIGGDAETTE